MARRVFFSFHYQNDIWRTGQVRNSWLTKGRETNTFMDSAAWESVKKRGAVGIKAWINRELKGTSVTVVLIGKETAARRYVNYEILRSHERGNGLLGIYIHGVKNSKGLKDSKGPNPFNNFYVEEDFLGLFKIKKPFSDIYPTYDWIWDGGRSNISEWIEEAARRAGKSRP